MTLSRALREAIAAFIIGALGLAVIVIALSPFALISLLIAEVMR